MRLPLGRSGDALFSFRCTSRLLTYLHETPVQPASPASTALGHWYGNLLLTKWARLIQFTSEATLLTVIVHARNRVTILPRFHEALEELLLALGQPRPLIQLELAQMSDYIVAKTASRSVLGSMRDLALQVRWRLQTQEHWSPLTIALELSEVPCGPLGMQFPREAASAALAHRHHP